MTKRGSARPSGCQGIPGTPRDGPPTPQGLLAGPASMRGLGTQPPLGAKPAPNLGIEHPPIRAIPARPYARRGRTRETHSHFGGAGNPGRAFKVSPDTQPASSRYQRISFSGCAKCNFTFRYEPEELGKCLAANRERDARDWPCCPRRSGIHHAVFPSIARQFGSAEDAQTRHRAASVS